MDKEAIAELTETGLRYAAVPKSAREVNLALALYEELSNQWMGRGLVHEGGGGDADGRQTVVVRGSIDLIALARRALKFTES